MKATAEKATPEQQLEAILSQYRAEITAARRDGRTTFDHEKDEARAKLVLLAAQYPHLFVKRADR